MAAKTWAQACSLPASAVAKPLAVKSQRPAAGAPSPSSGTASGANLTSGSVLRGSIKSFNKTSGYGFVVATGQQVDLYFQTRDLSDALQMQASQRDTINGVNVKFCVQSLRDGKWRARSIELASGHQSDTSGMPSGTLAAASRGRAGPSARQGAAVHSKHEIQSRVQQLVGMGFTEQQAHKALEQAGGLDVNKALDLLVSGAVPASDDFEETTEEYSSGQAYTAEASGTLAGDRASDILQYNVLTNWQTPVESGSPKISSEWILQAVGETSEPAPEPPTRTVAQDTFSVSVSVSEPKWRLARMLFDWSGDKRQSTISVRSGTLVWLWPNTKTEAGWIWVERASKDGDSGWVPADRLQELPAGMRWVSVMDESFCDSSELGVHAGDVVLANLGTPSLDGPVRVELCDGSKICWMPARAFGELPATCQWKAVTRSYEATQESQLTVREGGSVLVQTDTCTQEGWVYAWATDVGVEGGRQAGWVAAICLAGMEAYL